MTERSLAARLFDAQVASCSCLTKTPEIDYHDPSCHYRLFAEACRWMWRAASVLPLIPRRAGTHLAAEVSWLLADEGNAPPRVAAENWLLTELAELRENLRDTIGNDYARVVEDIERRLRDETSEQNEWGRMFAAWVKHQAGLPSDVSLWPNPEWSQDVAMVAHALAGKIL